MKPLKKNDVIVFANFDFIYLMTACLLAKLLGDLVLKAADLFVPVSYHHGAMISVVSVAVISLALVGLLTFRDGHHYASFHFASSLLSAGSAAILHFAIGLLTRFVPILFGPTRHLAGLISFGGFYNSVERTKQIPFGTLAVVGLLMMLVYAAVMILMGYIGCRKRLRDRAETTGSDEASI